MARLNVAIESDEEFPDVLTLLSDPSVKPERVPKTQAREVGKDTDSNPAVSTTPGFRKQRPLKLAHVNSLLLPFAHEIRRENLTGSCGSNRGKLCGPKDKHWQRKIQERSPEEESPAYTTKRPSSREAGRKLFAHAPLLSHRSSPNLSDEESSFVDHLSDFIVDDSASDIEAPSSHSPHKKEGLLRISKSQAVRPLSERLVIDLVSPKKTLPKSSRPETPPPGPSQEPLDEEYVGKLRLLASMSEDTEHSTNLTSSPPRSRTPLRRKESERPLTPPNGPPQSELQSPSKRLHRIPPSPHRPSIDAFWSQEVINDWNDQHSPRKPNSPRKLFPVREDDEAYLSPSTSRRQGSPTKTSGKRDKAAVERKKAFDERKVQLAVEFLKELDEKIAQGQVGALAESAGGIKVVWSKKLNSTAGRANWKRETLLSRDVGGAGTKVHRHHASIELAEKVIDDEERLINVLAHEYCHLANFMVSGIKNNPHGKEFKEWAAKTTALFAHRNITVTTKHTYTIAYKYIWACTSPLCGLEYKRHSKSIDPAKHSCGSCKGKLMQVQPPPRMGKVGAGGVDGKGKGEGVMSAYQAYVKSNCKRVRRENPGWGLGEVMKRLGEDFRQQKLREKEDVRKKIEGTVTVVDDDENEDGLGGTVGGGGLDGTTDDVVKKLDFLNLG